MHPVRVAAEGWSSCPEAALHRVRQRQRKVERNHRRQARGVERAPRRPARRLNTLRWGEARPPHYTSPQHLERKTMTIEVAEKPHARLGASGWHTWANCPGSDVLSEGLPNTSSSYAK